MQARPDRKNGKTDWVVSAPDKIHAAHELGGNGMVALNNVLAPKTKEIRRMLLKLRRHHRWSQKFLGAVLGVRPNTVQKWEYGLRNPCGSASMLIFLLHALLIKKRKGLNCLDLATWGQLPGVGVEAAAKMGESLELNSTYFIPNEQMLALLKMKDGRPDKK